MFALPTSSPSRIYVAEIEIIVRACIFVRQMATIDEQHLEHVRTVLRTVRRTSYLRNIPKTAWVFSLAPGETGDNGRNRKQGWIDAMESSKFN